jgi:hypothetical protein
MFSKLLNGASSPANCARKIAGPLIVFMRVNSPNSTEHLIMFSACRAQVPVAMACLILVGFAAAE